MIARQEKPKVLLVEDSEDDAFFFRRALRKTEFPCECSQVWDGAAATKYIGENASKGLLIFLDLKIPILNGFEVLEWLRKQPFKSCTNVVILSGSDDPHDINSARELGASDYMVKPLDATDLKRKLEAWASRTPAQGAT